MATRGSKHKPSHLRLVRERPGRPPQEYSLISPDTSFDNKLQPPKKLSRRQRQLWDQYIKKAPWLTHFDVPRAHMWVVMHAQWEDDPESMNAAKITQLRYLGSELGLDPSSRNRMGQRQDGRKKKEDPADEFFN